ncbi:MAG: hypothetical protein L0Z62_11310 [Gemmataceae bacterium]|nr:hypothetical protein [Gemmataceae bacterium]MCI0457548.1 hypothetical protein [Gemmataceae bacterium]
MATAFPWSLSWPERMNLARLNPDTISETDHLAIEAKFLLPPLSARFGQSAAKGEG